MDLKPVVEAARAWALEETEKYGVITKIHLDICTQKSKEICQKLKANQALVDIGVCLMDIKIGQAFHEKRISDHVQMGVEATKVFLREHHVTNPYYDIIVDAVAHHHGTEKFLALESEIPANIDCYKFISPVGVFHYINTLTKRGLSHNEIIDQAELKLNEKMAILSLDICKEELYPWGEKFREWFKAARV